METQIHIPENLLVQEKESLLSKKAKKESIGVPKESDENETRVALTPEIVAYFVEEGYEVFVEEGAGIPSGFENMDYSEVGAEITDNHSIYKCNILFKILPPSLEEIFMMNDNTILFSSLSIYDQDAEYFYALLSQKITAISYELIKDKDECCLFLQSMSEIAGLSLPLIAAEYLSHSKYGKGTLLGGITGLCPTKVVIIGTGTVARKSVPVFQAMGVSLKVFDYSLSCLRNFKQQIPSNIHIGNINDTEFKEAIKEADVVIAALYSEEYFSPTVLTEEIVRQMKYGSLIIDVSIDQGGCVETSRPTTLKSPIFRKYNVTHYCVPNIAARFPKSASIAISKNILTILQELTSLTEIRSLFGNDPNLQEAIYTYEGMITNIHISNRLGMPYNNLKFLFNEFWS